MFCVNNIVNIKKERERLTYKQNGIIQSRVEQEIVCFPTWLARWLCTTIIKFFKKY